MARQHHKRKLTGSLILFHSHQSPYFSSLSPFPFFLSLSLAPFWSVHFLLPTPFFVHLLFSSLSFTKRSALVKLPFQLCPWEGLDWCAPHPPFFWNNILPPSTRGWGLSLRNASRSAVFRTHETQAGPAAPRQGFTHLISTHSTDCPNTTTHCCCLTHWQST